MAKVNRIKIEPEIQNLNIASRFTEWTMRKLIRELEGYIEKDYKIKHSKISIMIEKMLEVNDKI